MSARPRIDDPCPLDAEARRAIDGHCGHCNRHVHRLDGMSACERRALFAAASGPICVSYRVPVPVPAPRRVGRIGAAIAATLITAAAHADDPVSSRAPPTVAEALQATQADPHASDDDLDVLIMGGIRAPQAQLEDEDASLPDLPVRGTDDTLVVAGETQAPTGTTPSPQP